MALVHDQSCEFASQSWTCFRYPPTHTSIEYGNYVEYHSLSSITNSGPIEFDVSSSGQNYLDVSNTQLLVKGIGVDITDADHVGGVSLFLHSLFKQVNVSLNDVQVSQSSGTYAYRASIESLLSYGPQAKNPQLTAALFYKNTAGNMDRSNPAHANEDERNFGLKKRASFTDEEGTVDLIGRIHSDVFFQDQFILNVKVRLVRNKDSFCLISSETNASYEVKIVSAVLLVRKVQLSPTVFRSSWLTQKALESGLAKYPITRVVWKTYTIPAGNLDGNHEKLFTAQLPTSLKFGAALPNTVTVVAYAEFENVIEIDRNRNVIYDKKSQLNMNTKDISYYLNRDSECCKMFYGVYSAAKIPNLSSLPALIVCNTDTSSKRWEHWIDLYVDKNRRGEYFDSFGRCPFEHFKIFLDENCSMHFSPDEFSVNCAERSMSYIAKS